MSTSLCTPNFDEISQSTADLLLLPVSENGRPPYWNSTSGFDFDLFIVIGMALRRPTKFHPNRSTASTHVGVMMSHRIFKMTAGSHVGFVWIILDHLRSATVGPSLVYKFRVNRIYSFEDILPF